MGLTFNGTTDLITIDPSLNTYLFGGTSVTTSHCCPFMLANGSLLLGYTANDAGGSGFVYRCRVATLDANGNITALTPSGTGTLIAGTSTSTNEQGSFVQLSGGNIVCVFEQQGSPALVSYSISTDNGVTWSAATTITSGAAGGASGSLSPHPCALLVGSTLFVVYVNSAGNIGLKTATVTSSSVGTFSSESTVSSTGGALCFDPTICNAGNSTLLVAYANNSSSQLEIVRSTDLTGASWGSASTYAIPAAGYNSNINPSFLVDGSILWMFYDLGTFGSSDAIGGNRTVVATTSANNGTTWSDAQVIYQGYSGGSTTVLNTPHNCDNHRANACLINGVPVVFSDSHINDTNYHICRLDMNPTCIAGLRAQGSSMPFNNLTTFTFGGWFKYSGSVNASGGMFMVFKGSMWNAVTQGRLLELNGFTGAAGHITIFAGYSTTSHAYVAAQTFTSGQWIFIAATTNLSGTAGSRSLIYTGTTPANLTPLAITSATDGVGTLDDDSSGNLCIGGRNIDQARTMLGDLDGLFVANSVLTLSQLKAAMTGATPSGVADGFWFLPASATSLSVLPDWGGNNNQATVFGTATPASPVVPTPLIPASSPGLLAVGC
jgi:hypothetical protein